MKYLLILLSTLFLNLSAETITINNKSSNIDILSHASIFIDETNTLSKERVIELGFQKNHKEIINLGIAPDVVLWIRFSLQNTTDQKLQKILEYANPETENIFFYDGERVIHEGMFHHPSNRSSINPIFTLDFQPYETKTIYIKASCKISTMFAKLTLWKTEDFFHKEYQHKIYIFIFFAIIATLIIYNAMLYIFTRDIIYFYYVSYLIGMLFFESLYLGVAQLYFFSNTLSEIMTKATIGYISLMVLPMLLFTMQFLNTKRFKKLHLFFTAYLYILPLISLLSYDNFLFNLNIMILFFPLAAAMLFAGIYALIHGTKEALFYLIGWTFLILSLLLSVLKSLGGYDIFQYFYYINEVGFVLEALLFSIALAYRINILSEAKADADAKLIDFQQAEQMKLEELVNTKTQDLQNSLEEKEILYKELNHRVKNNLQMILALIKLQINKTDTESTKEELTITKNRINSIAKLYETLHLTQNDINFDTLSYFKDIVKNIQNSSELEVTIEYEIKYNISVENSIYCGIILNELVTNSFKHAFSKEGTIWIRTEKEGKKICMSVEDNGIGFDKDKNTSLGLIIVNTLAKKQLNADIVIISKDRTKTTIIWNEK